MKANAQAPPARFGTFNNGARQSILMKEISFQPTALRNTLKEQGQQVARFVSYLKKCNTNRVDVVGIGSSYHAANVCAMLVQGIYLNVQEPSEYRPTSNAAIVISQSGESSDNFPVIETMKKNGVSFAGLTNTPESTLARTSDFPLFTSAPKEESIAATASMTCAMATILNIGAIFGGNGAKDLFGLP